MSTNSDEPIGKIVNGELHLGQHHLHADVPQASFIPALQGVAALVDTCMLLFEEDAIRTRAIAPSRVAMVDLEYTDVEYTTHFTPVAADVELDNLVKNASFTTTNTETVQLAFGNGDEHLRTSAGNRMTYTALSEPSGFPQDPGIAGLDYATIVTVDAMAFKGAVGAVSGASSRGIQLTASEDGLRAAGGERTGDGFPYERSIDADVDGPAATSVYSDGFLTDIAATIRPTGEITMAFGDDWPLQVRTPVGVTVTLAPQLNGEEDSDE
jgi:hypothetical protein